MLNSRELRDAITATCDSIREETGSIVIPEESAMLNGDRGLAIILRQLLLSARRIEEAEQIDPAQYSPSPEFEHIMLDGLKARDRRLLPAMATQTEVSAR